MGWVKLSDDFADHPKIRKADKRGVLLTHLRAMCYCGRYRTDGLVDDDFAPLADASALVAIGLWVKVDGGYEINGWLEYNLSREQDDKRREYERKRKREWRAARDRAGDKEGGPVRDGRRDSAAGPLEPEPEPDTDTDQSAKSAISEPKGSSSASADAAWFLQAWNGRSNGLPKVRQIGPERARAVRGLLKAAHGDRELVESAIDAFGRWGFAHDRKLGVDTFLRAKNRDRHLEWAETGPPNSGEPSSAQRRSQATDDAIREFYREENPDAQ